MPFDDFFEAKREYSPYFSFFHVPQYQDRLLPPPAFSPGAGRGISSMLSMSEYRTETDDLPGPVSVMASSLPNLTDTDRSPTRETTR